VCPGPAARTPLVFPRKVGLITLNLLPATRGWEVRLCGFCRPPDADEKILLATRWAKTAHESA
jgi:hypothetical protein